MNAKKITPISVDKLAEYTVTVTGTEIVAHRTAVLQKIEEPMRAEIARHVRVAHERLLDIINKELYGNRPPEETHGEWFKKRLKAAQGKSKAKIRHT